MAEAKFAQVAGPEGLALEIYKVKLLTALEQTPDPLDERLQHLARLGVEGKGQSGSGRGELKGCLEFDVVNGDFCAEDKAT